MQFTAKVSNRDMDEASRVLAAAAGSGPLPEIEVMPGFEVTVAAASVVLEQLAPAQHVRHTAERWLEKDTRQGQALHDATVEVIDMHRRGEHTDALTYLVVRALGWPDDADHAPESLSDHATRAIGDASAVLDRHLASLSGRDRYVDRRVADFQDFGGPPLFRAVPTSAYDRVDQLSSGAAPLGPVEAGVVASLGVAGYDDDPGRGCRARALIDNEGRDVTAQQVAVRIAAEHVRVRNAPGDVETSEPAVQVAAFREVETADRVPPVTMVRLGLMAFRVEAEQQARQAELATEAKHDPRQVAAATSMSTGRGQ